MAPTGAGDDAHTQRYNRLVGNTLRRVRREIGLSLLDVEERSTGEFKASVLGAYERGERAMSLHRLDRLAAIYEVPVGRLLPSREPDANPDARLPAGGSRLCIDVDRLARLDEPGFRSLADYLRGIQVRRDDLGGSSVTVRDADRLAIAAILRVPENDVVDELRVRGLLIDGK
jgi:transcriptional regulator with XRE-family HTH domain